jgi:hypothetical protein
MSIDNRLSQPASALSSQERAILVLRSMKDKIPEDPAGRRTIPDAQSVSSTASSL